MSLSLSFIEVKTCVLEYSVYGWWSRICIFIILIMKWATNPVSHVMCTDSTSNILVQQHLVLTDK